MTGSLNIDCAERQQINPDSLAQSKLTTQTAISTQIPEFPQLEMEPGKEESL
jgi:hypothetical protein